jgi:hypothetical protein
MSGINLTYMGILCQGLLLPANIISHSPATGIGKRRPYIHTGQAPGLTFRQKPQPPGLKLALTLKTACTMAIARNATKANTSINTPLAITFVNTLS